MLIACVSSARTLVPAIGARARHRRWLWPPPGVVPCLQSRILMLHRLPLIPTSLLFAALVSSACASKPHPKSTSTTSTQTTTTTDTGNNTETKTKETTTEQPDGSSTVEKTQTTKTDAPKP